MSAAAPPIKSAVPLNYYQQSPVRGQLEVPEGAGKTGWRYIQCTDTPNELRVLLPPRTSLIYAHLLRSEAVELARDRAANWERIVLIRHLKDRMIRKCSRLARDALPKDKAAPRIVFQTIHAPPDFRLKEMERWYRAQPQNVPSTGDGMAPGPQYCCPKCAQQGAPGAVASAPVKRAPSAATRQVMRGRSPEQAPRRGSAGPSHGQTITYTHVPPPAHRPEQRPRVVPPPRRANPPPPPDARHANTPPRPTEGRRSRELLREPQVSRPAVRSPEPVPIPYRGARAPDSFSDDTPSEPSTRSSPRAAPPQILDLPPSTSPVPQSSSPEPSPTPPKVSTPPNGLPTIHEVDSAGDAASVREDAPPQRPLVRRRSSLKKRDSMSRLSVGSQSKSVAWAMDRDWLEQMGSYMKSTDEAEMLNIELERLRVQYHEEIEAMRLNYRCVQQAQERVRLETENLRSEESAALAQQTKVLESSEQLERKQVEFQEKVLAVLEEAKRVVQLCDKKRDLHEST